MKTRADERHLTPLALELVVTPRHFAAALREDLGRGLGCRRWWWAREVRIGSGTEWRVTSSGPSARPPAEAWEALCRALRRARGRLRGPVPGAPFLPENGTAWLLDGRRGRRGVVAAIPGGGSGAANPARDAALGIEMRAAYARALAGERIERECDLHGALLEASADAVLLLDWELKCVAHSSGAAARMARCDAEALPDTARRRLYLMRAAWERALLSWRKPDDESAFLKTPEGIGVDIRMLTGRDPEAACPHFLIRFHPAPREDSNDTDWRTIAIRRGIEPGFLRLLAEGATTGRMASAAGVSPTAIRARLSRLYRRFGCPGRIALLRRLAEDSTP